MKVPVSGEEIALAGAQAILAAFDRFHQEFKCLTRRAPERFVQQDWLAAQRDAVERLDLYPRVVQKIVADFRENPHAVAMQAPSTWTRMRRHYSRLIAGRDDLELAETFYNSVSRRIFSTVGVDERIEYIDTDFELPDDSGASRLYTRYPRSGSTADLLRTILAERDFQAPYKRLEQTLPRAAQQIDSHISSAWGAGGFEAAEVLEPVFFRNKGAYLIGRLVRGAQLCPLLIALRHPQGGTQVDAVLLSEDEASIVFSYTRSYFHVEADAPHQLVSFLRSILPQKRIAELYISIGYNKHGKTELYRDLLLHLSTAEDRFQIAPGQRGMVMAVFTLPSYDMVFKIIKDRFAEPKRTTREEVMSRYQLVFKHDRAGRLVDAQEFEHLQIDSTRFDEALLAELLDVAGETVTLEDGCVNIRHLYTERRMTPLDVYVNEASPTAVEKAVLDYGQAIKDLAATNIFPGDILLKNFGVTRHGRVVFYDYDELTLLTACKFRRMPQPSDYEESMHAEPWFYVGRDDIFPEEFRTFLGLPSPYREIFVQHHGDLFEASFWRQMQKKHRLGEVMDTFPYPSERRLDSHAVL